MTAGRCAARQLGICADDYGLAPAVDCGILALAAQGRITALSALVTLPRWAAAGVALHRAGTGRGTGGVSIGLHLNFTEGEPLSAALRRDWPRFPSLQALIVRACSGRLPAALADEVQAQLLRFADVTGRAPDFIDGHQHVHALPGVRPFALAAAEGLGVPLRNTGRVLGPGFAFKRWVIQTLGGRALAAEMHARGLAAAPALLGVYDFSPHANYRALMQAWLRSAPEGALFFCHPALGGPDAGDPIAAARQREMAYLAGPDFAADLAEAGVSLG